MTTNTASAEKVNNNNLSINLMYLGVGFLFGITVFIIFGDSILPINQVDPASAAITSLLTVLLAVPAFRYELNIRRFLLLVLPVIAFSIGTYWANTQPIFSLEECQPDRDTTSVILAEITNAPRSSKVRFDIYEDLTSKFKYSNHLLPISICPMDVQIAHRVNDPEFECSTESECAEQFAYQNMGDIIIWGDYLNGTYTINQKLVTGSLPEYIQTYAEDIATTTIRFSEEAVPIIFAPYVIDRLALHYNAIGNGFGEIAILAINCQVTETVPATDKSEYLRQYNVTENYAASEGLNYILYYCTDSDEAARHIKNSVDHPFEGAGNPLGLISQSALFLREGDFEAALNNAVTAERVVKAPGVWTMPQWIRVVANMMQGTPHAVINAMRELDQMTSNNQTDWFAPTLASTLAYTIGEYDKAWEYVDTAKSRNPTAPFAYLMEISLQLRNGEVVRAKQVLDLITDESDQNSNTLTSTLSRTLTEFAFGDAPLLLTPLFAAYSDMLILPNDGKAQENANKGLQLLSQINSDPGQQPLIAQDFLLLQGFAQCRQGNYADAIDSYSNALAINDDFMLLYFLRSEVMLKEDIRTVFETLYQAQTAIESDDLSNEAYQSYLQIIELYSPIAEQVQALQSTPIDDLGSEMSQIINQLDHGVNILSDICTIALNPSSTSENILPLMLASLTGNVSCETFFEQPTTSVENIDSHFSDAIDEIYSLCSTMPQPVLPDTESTITCVQTSQEVQKTLLRSSPRIEKYNVRGAMNMGELYPVIEIDTERDPENYTWFKIDTGSGQLWVRADVVTSETCPAPISSISP